MTPEQRLNADEAAQEKIERVLAKEDARYDAMNEAEREKYYLKPSLIARIRRYFGH